MAQTPRGIDYLPFNVGDIAYLGKTKICLGKVEETDKHGVRIKDDWYFADTLTHSGDGFDPVPRQSAIWMHKNTHDKRQFRVLTSFVDYAYNHGTKFVIVENASTHDVYKFEISDFVINHKNTGKILSHIES